uniref:Uncharacterized protein n=1 Tax=Rhizophora mucronata TaxID=61149 RepID=A0A2P2QLJ8_RHIMU
MTSLWQERPNMWYLISTQKSNGTSTSENLTNINKKVDHIKLQFELAS